MGTAVGRRNIELGLVLFAAAISVFADVQVELTLHGALPDNFGGLCGVLTVAAVLAHLAVRRWARHADPLILPIAVLLTGLGLTMVHRLDITYALIDAGFDPSDATPEAPTQLQWTVIAALVFVVALAVVKHHRLLQRYTYLTMALSMVLLIAPAFFPAINGAKRWISLGPLHVEPDEFTKIGMIVFFAGYLMANRDVLVLVGRRFWGVSLPRMRDLGPLLVVWALCLLVLVVEVDLGTSLIIFGIFILMLYITTQRIGWVVVGLLLAVVGGGVVGAASSHVGQRVTAWLHPMDAFLPHPTVTNQPALALFALGHGRISGTGLGRGQSWLIGTAGRSDWIFAAFGEELGTAGLMALLCLYLLLAHRGWRAAISLTDPFGKLLAAGLASVLVLQVFVVAGGVVGLLPETGKALPFVSQGGSSAVANWLLAALLIKLSDAAGRSELSPPPHPGDTLTVSTGEIRAHFADAQ
ncbi:FtsW/RodA/SpoVE family cell cycle protein [Streptacidiphilus neutrinimicus]|uniref:FtsW/RodA/SpoVE family cell cycle protein n=1 Tax=Streptacidiphilus neutrinimicus TaxID=105420 RepID=UPI0005A6BDC0|nr:FtsW/RodA/SpoVE family cell cycle protein [Streptacidiphilus neutrinimicus]